MQASIYNFRDHRAALKSLFESGGRRRTLKQWADHLGYRSHRSLGMVLSGERLPTPKLLNRITAQFKFTPEEHRYLELLVEKARLSEKPEELSNLDMQLEQLVRNLEPTEQVQIQEFAHIAEWYVLAIKQLIECPSFDPDPNWISKKLKRRIRSDQAEKALRILCRIGIVHRSADGKYEVVKKRLRTPIDTPSVAIKMHHLQMLRRAAQSIFEDPITNRENVSLTFRFSRDRLPEIKRYLRDVRDEFDRRFSSETGDDVFQMIGHIFAHTEERIT